MEKKDFIALVSVMLIIALFFLSIMVIYAFDDVTGGIFGDSWVGNVNISPSTSGSSSTSTTCIVEIDIVNDNLATGTIRCPVGDPREQVSGPTERGE